jgi:hypothetical protein
VFVEQGPAFLNIITIDKLMFKRLTCVCMNLFSVRSELHFKCYLGELHASKD